MYTAKILDIQEDAVAGGESFLDVEIGVFEGEKQVDVRKQSMPLESSEKDVKSMVKKFIDLYNKEVEMAVIDAEKQEKKKKVSKTISKLKGEEIL